MNLRLLDLDIKDKVNVYAMITQGNFCTTYHKSIEFKHKYTYPFNSPDEMAKSIVSSNLTSNEIDIELEKEVKVKFIKTIDTNYCLIYIINTKQYTIIAMDIFNKQRIKYDRYNE